VDVVAGDAVPALLHPARDAAQHLALASSSM
jgi:hypothetical protein